MDDERRPVGSPHFEAYSIGIVCASICTNMPIEDAVVHMNYRHPSGTTNGWKLSEDKTFRGGGENGCPCHANHAPGARHWLLEC